MELNTFDMELLEKLRKKLEMVEAFWWFVENGTGGYCCPHALGARRKFEVRDAQEVFDLIALLHTRKEHKNG